MSQSAIETLHTDPKLVFDLASGLETLKTIADRYELDVDFLQELMDNPRIKKIVAEKKKELDDTGYTLAQKAKLCFEDLLGDVYKKARDPGASLGATLAAAEFFRKVANLDRPDSGAQADKFSITINLAGAVPGSHPITLEATASKPTFQMPNMKQLFLQVPEYIMPGAADVNLTDLAYAGE